MSDLPPEELVKRLNEAYHASLGSHQDRAFLSQAAALIERLEAERDEWTIERAVGQRQLDELSARVTELEGATTAFLAKWDECKPHIDDAFVHRQLRCGPYTGPDLAEELDALRKASKSLAQGEG